MRTKDEIISAQSKLILDLLRVGQDKFQEVTNLFCEIEKLPKDEEVSSVTHKNVIVFKKEKICPRCGIRPRKVAKSGKVSPYCGECNSIRIKDYRNKLVQKSNDLLKEL